MDAVRVKKPLAVDPYLQLNRGVVGQKYLLVIGGLKLYFGSRREANEYYLKYLR